EAQARSTAQVFFAVHRNDLDPKVLAYQYLQTLPELARGQGNTFWVIPSEVTSALAGIAHACGPCAPAWRRAGGVGPAAPVARPADVELEVAEPDATGPASNGTAYTAG